MICRIEKKRKRRRKQRTLSMTTPQTAGVKPAKDPRSHAAAPPRVGTAREAAAADAPPAKRAGSEVATCAIPIQIMIQTVTWTLLTNWFSPSVLRT